MKLRLIIIVLVLLSFLSTSIGGYLYYSSMRRSELDKTRTEDDEKVRDIVSHINISIQRHKESVQALAGLDELQQALNIRDQVSIDRANSILDLFHEALNLDVCYLMDSTGETVASSNRSAPDSFVGRNYAFRPYFWEAFDGNPSIYLALGVTSKKRGLYAGHPIYGKAGNSPVGVVVIKSSIVSIEESLAQTYEGIMLLTDPHGVVFVSSYDEWLYHFMWKPSPEDSAYISESRQFGNGPLQWTGLEKREADHVIDKSGKEYHLHEREITNYPGWNITYLHDHEAVSARIAAPLLKSTLYIILPLLVVIGLSVLFLYRRANQDIIKRQVAEDSLRENEMKLKALSLTDELTGLYNRRGFFALAEQHLRQSMRERRGNFLIVTDLDNLKRVNDNFGHNEGDLVLIKTANILKESYRESDIVARIGGDEFVILANEAPETDIETIVARLRENINHYNRTRIRGQAVSLSIGVVRCSHEEPCNLDRLIAEADKLMYQDKRRKGRPQ